PFLGHAARQAPDCLERLFVEGPEAALESAIEDFRAAEEAPNQQRAMAALRQARLRAALTVGLADLGGAWSTMEATAALSRAAEAAIEAAIRWLARDAVRRGVLEAGDDPAPVDGLIVLGMGKLGARELNYSSDIDLILLYDGDLMRIRRLDRLQQEMTRLARALVPLLEERTRDGYVYRTDLRLRPDPASTPPAVSARAAEVYYESMGQNWERAAMIKARPVAGDKAAGGRFLSDLRPFVWRRSLDFNAIRDIQSIKRQIDSRQGGEPPSAFDHNVKLGRGGIREIEFFAQTQQLIWGGRNPDLRAPETLAALDALSAAGLVEPAVSEDMKASYLKLRDVEHRLQMVDDRQTHTTPAAADAQGFARFAGFETAEAFAEDLVATLRTVEGHYGDLFAEEPGLGGGGSLSFTGAEEHPDTLATIRGMGFADAENVSRTIRGWHHGRVRALRDRRAREILTEITPDILRRFGETPDPDRAFAAFERFVAGLPAGVQLFTLLDANRNLLDFLARALGRSAYLAALIGR
ncbi:MAG: glutamine-synthetase adenylyltransferase, partial [Alphaproteobacteria bacterium]